MATRTCPVCQADVDVSDSVCPECGASMTGDAAVPAGTPQPVDVPSV
ncbi:MAG TPA: hypothetical protein VD886_21530 [Herpetosiphonaceae bacterium]|nr:hypothetical protein [Herpetosiphonaceae bacterium]